MSDPPELEKITRFLQLDLAGWSGLGEGTTVADFESACGQALGGYSVARLGSEVRPVRYGRLPNPFRDEPVELWFTDEGVVAAAATEIYGLGEDAAAALLDDLGEPEVALDYWFDVVRIEGGERVWPARGIALLVLPDEGQLDQLIVFPPTTGAGYRADLQLDREVHEFPMDDYDGELVDDDGELPPDLDGEPPFDEG